MSTNTRNGIGRDYLDGLKSKSPMYDSIAEVVVANYPDVSETGGEVLP